MSRLQLLLVMTIVGLGCRPAGVTPPVPPAPPPPPPPPPPPNHAPVAVAGGPYTSADGTVSFDGSASADPDGDALTYRWDFGDGGAGGDVKPSHLYQLDGSYK